MGQLFVPTQTFEAEVNGNTNRYLKGQRYTVHDTSQHKDLAKKVQEWHGEGKVKIIGHTAGRSVPTAVRVNQ